MPQITFINAQGERKVVDAAVGDTLMQAALGGGVDGVAAECGGCLSCATCHTYISDEWADRLPAASEDEKVMIDCAMDVRPTSRLSCQVAITEDMEGLEVEIPESQY